MAKTLADYQADIDNATSALKAATTNRDNAYNTAKASHDSLFKCVKGKGTTTNCSDGQPLGSSKFPSFGNLANAQDCKICNSTKNCETDCCKEDTCVARVNEYNGKIGTYNAAVVSYNSAVTNLAVANKAKTDAIATDPNIKNEEAARKTKNGVIYVVVIGVIVIVVIWAWFKYKK